MKKNNYLPTLLLLVVALFASPRSQGQTLDPTFQPTVLKTSPSFLSPLVRTLVVQPNDGKVLLGGGFDFLNGVQGGKLRRLNPDGTTDLTFNPGGLGPNGFVQRMLIQADGKIIISGGFTTYNGTPAGLVTRLNANGTLDPTFNAGGAGVDFQLGALAQQADGKLLLGGLFTMYNGQPANGIVRLNTDGTRDTSFQPTGLSTPNQSSISTILVQADGKIVVGGNFPDFNGQNIYALVRLNANGTTDNTFSSNPAFQINSNVLALAQQPDGKLLVGGALMTGTTTNGLTRLLPSGAVDNTFAPITNTTSGGVTSIQLLASGQLVIGGSFTQYAGTARARVARVNADGTLDATFVPGTGFNTTVLAIAVAPGGQVLAGGSFISFNGTPAQGLAQLTTTGARDASFAAVIEGRGSVTQAAPLPGNQLLITGNFTEFNGTAVAANSIQRVTATGALDPSFVLQVPASSFYAVQPNGDFYTVSTNLNRVLASGQTDNTFTAQLFRQTATSNGIIRGVIVQPDGRIVVYGTFITYGGVARFSVLRLLADGTLDTSFVPPAAPTGTTQRNVYKALLQSNGQLIFIYEDYFNGTPAGQQLARLYTNGSLDPSYPVGSGPSAQYLSLAALLLPNDNLLLSGNFTSFSTQNTPTGVVRLTRSGIIDNSFIGPVSGGRYNFQAVQADGKILAINYLLSSPVPPAINAASTLVRLNANGSIDASFAAVAIPQGYYIGDYFLGGVFLQAADSKIMLWGSFAYVAGQSRIGLARLNNATVTATRSDVAVLPLNAFPNPAQRFITLPSLSGSAGSAVLIDLQGRTVRTWPLLQPRQETKLGLDAVAPGIYLLRVPTSTGAYQQKVAISQ